MASLPSEKIVTTLMTLFMVDLWEFWYVGVSVAERKNCRVSVTMTIIQ